MEQFLDFFESIPSAWRTIALAGGVAFFWLLEGVIPLFAFAFRRWRHAGLNIILTIFQLVIGFSLGALIVWAADFTTAHRFGILYVINLPLWLHVVLGILLLDFIGAWLVHWIEHRIRWMWKFHIIHHTDTTIDVTSGLRHHPGETVFRSAFGLLGVLIAGVPIGVFLMYQTLSIIFTQLTHANIKSPKRLDHLFSFVFVTPNMHKVHHHYVQPLTDTNYGNIFSIWDRLFGTFAEVDDVTSLKYGIDTHMKPEEHSRLVNLLTIPFQTYRPPSGSKFSSTDQDHEY